MSRKRQATDTLTGGTNDVNPQWLRTKLVGTLGSIVTAQIPMPIQRLPDPRGRAQVVEVLKVCWKTNLVINTVNTTYTNYVTNARLATKNPGTTATVDPSDGSVLDYLDYSRILSAPAANASEAEVEVQPIFHELHDGAGHGILVGTDNLFLQFANAGFTAGDTVNTIVSIMYRFKDVSLAEYIGIVQSQQ